MRRVFYSFHYQNDVWRTSQIRNIGSIEGNKPASDNNWEEVKRGGIKAIQNWIDNQLSGRSCTIVLIGNQTASRKWINYEIEKSWELSKGIFGIYIHNLKDSKGNQSEKGKNPFENFTVNGIGLEKIIKTYDPPFTDSKKIYDWIREHIEQWIEEAIKQVEKRYGK